VSDNAVLITLDYSLPLIRKGMKEICLSQVCAVWSRGESLSAASGLNLIYQNGSAEFAAVNQSGSLKIFSRSYSLFQIKFRHCLLAALVVFARNYSTVSFKISLLFPKSLSHIWRRRRNVFILQLLASKDSRFKEMAKF